MQKNNYKPTNLLFFAALSYAKRGWKVLPLHTPVKNGCSCGRSNCSSIGKHPRTKNGLKDATDTKQTISEWWKKWPNANIGIVTGNESGIVVLDIDPQHGGDIAFDELIHNLGELPDTVECFTGGGGRHIYFSHPGNEIVIKNKVGLDDYPGIDVRGDGGYIVAPPSLHKSRKRYEWEASSDPTAVPLVSLPKQLLVILKHRKRIAIESDTELQKIPIGKRNITLTSIAGKMRSQGLEFDEIFPAIIAINKNRSEIPLPKEEIENLVKSVCKYPPGKLPTKIQGKKIKNLTDLGNAERLIQQHLIDLHYCHPWKKWLVWDHVCWKIDDTAEIIRRAKDAVRKIYAEASTVRNAGLRIKIADHAELSESESKIRAMIKLTSAEPGIPIIPDELDRDSWLLNVKNGTLNLKNGVLGNHSREDLLTKLVPVNYDVHAECPIWNKFLNRIFDHNKNLIEFLQRAVGYSLTGDTSDQVLFILYGTGANGKSTFLTTINKIMNDYSCQTSIETLIVTKGNRIPNDLARLKGIRFVSSVEAEAGSRMSENLIKQLTGGDKLAARFLYGEYFEFWPTHKIFIATNHKLIIRGTDHAIWRRIRLIPFLVKIPPEEQDKQLMKKLEDELSGILSWAVEGCLKWQENGLGFPEEVLKATEEYREEMDILARFLNDCCVIEKSKKVQACALYKNYQDWADQNGEFVLSQQRLGISLRERGFVNKRSTGGRFWWYGIGLNEG